MSLKSYPKYIESGIPWLTNCPEDWEMLKTKNLFSERVEKGYPNEPLLAATQTKGVIPKTLYETRTVIAQKDLHLLKLVEPGDFVISLRSFQGGIEKAHYRGIISPAYTILFPDQKILGEYFKHLAKSKPFIKLLTTCVTGIREGQNIDYDILRRTKLPVPPIEDQKQIARYLDWKTTQIAKFIKAKKKLIELLKEQKQVIINDAVTGKIDVRTGNPYPKYKDSGTDWLGRIPAEWDIVKIKHLFIESDLRKGNKDFPLLSFSRAKGLVHYNEVYNRPPSASDFTKYRVCLKGQLLMNRMQAWSGMFTSVNIDGIVSPDYSIFNPKIDLEVEYYGLLFKTKLYVQQFANASQGVGDGFNRLYTPDFGAIRASFPKPSLQVDIVNFIMIKCSEIDLSITKIQKELDLFQEYRARLIADVVTGRIDVRNIKIPDFEKVDTIADLEEPEENEEVLYDIIIDNDL
jgi:type I restriction enzyme S subunit